MSDIKLQIKFNRQDGVYYSGDKLAGNLILLNANQLADAKTLTLIVSGRSENHWVNKNSDKIFECREEHLKNVRQFEPANPNSTNMVTGAKNFCFEFDLPESLPSTFDGAFGQILYSARGELYETDEDTPTATIERSFVLITKVDLANHPATMQPVEAVDTTEFIFCSCFPLGSVRTVVTVPKNGYLPYEQIPVSVVLYNGTRRKLKRASLNLIQRVTFRAKSRYENVDDEKDIDEIVAGLSRGAVLPRTFLRIEKDSLTVPNVPPTYRDATIGVSYKLQFTAYPSVEVDLPVVIGSRHTANKLNNRLNGVNFSTLI